MQTTITLVSGFLGKFGMRLFGSVIKGELERANHSKEVNELVDRGIDKHLSELYTEAVDLYEKAIEIDNKCMRARTNMLKALRADGKSLEVFICGGEALSMAKSPEAKVKIYNYMGRTAEELFKAEPKKRYVDLSIKLYMKAHNCNPKDIIPAWNLLEMNILASIKLENIDNKTRLVYEREAVKRYNYLMLLLKSNARNPQSSWVKLLEYSINFLEEIEDAEWKEKLEGVKKECHKELNRREERREQTESIMNSKTIAITGAAVICIIISVLLSFQKITAKPEGESAKELPAMNSNKCVGEVSNINVLKCATFGNTTDKYQVDLSNSIENSREGHGYKGLEHDFDLAEKGLEHEFDCAYKGLEHEFDYA